MANNADLTAAILEINPEAETEGLTNKQLSDMLKELKTPVATAEATAVYEVAEGRAVTVPGRGMLSEGEMVKAEWLHGGEKQAEYLKSKGILK